MKHIAILERLSQLPRKMAHMRGHDALPDCVLYELVSDMCFNCIYAAYCVYNPDFHLCKGVAGISRMEMEDWTIDPWNDLDQFEEQVRQTSFNQKVRNINFCITREAPKNTLVETIQNSLDSAISHAHVWDVHNKNQGIFLYALQDEKHDTHDRIADGASLLSFCFF